jgi:KipI family sensor histidine kinase inhibitor
VSDDVRIAPLGDGALLVTLGDMISRECARRVRAVERAIRHAHIAGVTDVVPAYTTVGVYFDRMRTDHETVRAALDGLARTPSGASDVSGKLVEIPVRYDGEDLADVAERTGLTTSEVIERHARPTYYAYMLGFAPGFAYLGDLDPALVLPRRAEPRVRVPAGSVAIAGAQTAVYPLETAGGWHILGHTSRVMFDARRDPPSLIQAGDEVRFIPETR